MKRIFWKRTSFFALLGLLACGGGPSAPTFEELIDEGWTAFQQGDYQTASDRFSEATAMNRDDAEGFTGLGWSLFKLDNLTRASTEFTGGSNTINATADLFAGWAFVLNAEKNNERSNEKADEALALNPNWNFPYGLSLSTDDLHVLKAENHFLLGEFAESLSEVQVLNSNFDVDVSTSAGQAALTVEIERLKGIV